MNNDVKIVIDAGHGGSDPGKIGCDGVLEKDINLSIALLLKDALEKENLHIGSAGYTMPIGYGLLCLDAVRCLSQAGGGMERGGEGRFRGSVVARSE